MSKTEFDLLVRPKSVASSFTTHRSKRYKTFTFRTGLLAMHVHASRGAKTLLGAIAYYNQQNPGVLPFLCTSAIAGCTSFAAAIMNTSSDQTYKNAATHAFALSNAMSAFGAVGSLAAFVYGQAKKDEIPIPVLQDHGGVITRTLTRNIRRKTRSCKDVFNSLFGFGFTNDEETLASVNITAEIPTVFASRVVSMVSIDGDLELGLVPISDDLEAPTVGVAVTRQGGRMLTDMLTDLASVSVYATMRPPPVLQKKVVC